MLGVPNLSEPGQILEDFLGKIHEAQQDGRLAYVFRAACKKLRGTFFTVIPTDGKRPLARFQTDEDKAEANRRKIDTSAALLLPSWLAVIDVDDPERFQEHFGLGRDELEALATVRTGKGFHIYVFDPDHELKGRNDIRGFEVIRHQNDLVMLPGSRIWHEKLQRNVVYEVLNPRILSLEELREALPEEFFEAPEAPEAQGPQRAVEEEHPKEWAGKKVNLARFRELLRKHYREGQRQNLVMYAAGFLAKMGVPEGGTLALIEDLAREMGDEEPRQRLAAVRHTYVDFEAGYPIKGLAGLMELGIAKEEVEACICEHKPYAVEEGRVWHVRGSMAKALAVKEGDRLRVVFCEPAYRAALMEAVRLRARAEALKQAFTSPLDHEQRERAAQEYRRVQQRLKELDTDWRSYAAVLGCRNAVVSAPSLNTPARATVWLWDCSKWRPTSAALALLQREVLRIRDRARRAYAEITGEEAPNWTKEAKEFAGQLAFEAGGAARVHELTPLAQVTEWWERIFPRAVPVFTRSAVYVVSAKGIEKRRPDRRFFNTIAIPHEPKEVPTPNFDSFLRKVFSSRATQKAFISIIGYCLSPVKLWPYVFFFYGDGQTGKTTAQNIIRRVVGPHNTVAIPLESLSDVTIERFAYALANLAAESQAKAFNEDLIKAVTDQNPRECNPKYRDPYTIVPLAAQIFALNKMPPVSDLSEGFWRRCVVIPFKHKISNPDPFFIQNLRDEIPGIFFRALQALQEIVAHGGRIDFGEEIERATRSYREETSSIIVFLKEFAEDLALGRDLTPYGISRERILTKQYGHLLYVYIPRQDFYRAFSMWAAANRYHPPAYQEFFNRLKVLDLEALQTPITVIGTEGRTRIGGTNIRIVTLYIDLKRIEPGSLHVPDVPAVPASENLSSHLPLPPLSRGDQFLNPGTSGTSGTNPSFPSSFYFSSFSSGRKEEEGGRRICALCAYYGEDEDGNPYCERRKENVWPESDACGEFAPCG